MQLITVKYIGIMYVDILLAMRYLHVLFRQASNKSLFGETITKNLLRIFKNVFELIYKAF